MHSSKNLNYMNSQFPHA
uniref:Uncharacterized protein n=1 Tax=Arundo donax TaxID=35708 RepID=A0A0A9BT15_ARUDO